MKLARFCSPVLLFLASHCPAQAQSTTTDDALRVATYTTGCNGGDMQSCANLGTMYRMGWGTPEDLPKASTLFAKACSGGDSSGCASLALMRSRGEVAVTATGTRAAAGCARTVSFAVLRGTQVVPEEPTFAQKWLVKNAKKYPSVCFSQTPNLLTANYVLVLSTNQFAVNGIYPTVRTSTNVNTVPISGNGTVTDNYGGMWNFSYTGTETVTTTTTSQISLPYTDTTNTLYITIYDQDGHYISQHWRAITTREGGDGYNTLGYNLGSLISAIHVKERLLKDALTDIPNTPRS